MSKEASVLDQLRKVIDPDLHKDIVTLGFIKDLKIDEESGHVSFICELTTPACPVKEKFREWCHDFVMELDWVSKVDVKLTAQPARSSLQNEQDGLTKVRHIIAVASCKGGVGKSTVATNLSFALQSHGARVGIFDADIYGPSLPTMVDTEFEGLYQEDNMIVPEMHSSGIKLMSFAYASGQQGGPAIMRGPMVTNVIVQMLNGTDWGELDYLVIDMPPGTGDIQLTLAQSVNISASVMVTTPQKISFIDVVKGIEMFDKLKVPVISVVENMSYYLVGDEKHFIFGKGARQQIVDQFGIENAFEIPIHPELATCGDTGLPLTAAQPAHEIAKVYGDIAENVVREVERLRYNQVERSITWEPSEGIIYTVNGKQFTLSTHKLRCACRCAHCIQEFTGEQLLDPSTVPENIGVTSFNDMGNYAIQIGWDDGHTSIYPFKRIEELVGYKEDGESV